MSKEAMKLALEQRITDYLSAGGLFNPELADHLAVRDLLIDCRKALAKPDFWEGYEPEPVKQAQCKYPKCSYPCTDLPDCRDAEQPAQQDSTCSNALRAQGKAYPRTCKKCGLGPCVELAQQALDKKAENARELGLDYEPAKDSGIVTAGGSDPRTQRTWVGLTDEERKLVRNSVGYNQFVTAGEYAEHVQKATEFKLLEKNT